MIQFSSNIGFVKIPKIAQMKILIDKDNPMDHEFLPHVGEEIMTPNEYVANYIRIHGLEQAKVMRNSLWTSLFRQGVDNKSIDFAFKSNGI